MNKDDILDRLRKMKALADRGVGGERNNALRMLEIAAAKYGINLELIDGDKLEKFYIKILPWKKFKRKLLCQLCELKRRELKAQGCHLTDDRMTVWKCKTRNKYAVVDCTEAEWLEISAKLEILERAFNRQEEEFYTAFLMANNLLIGRDDDENEEAQKNQISREERQKCFRIAQMSRGISKTHIAPMLEERDL